MDANTHWLNRERISSYPRIFLALFLVIICSLWFFMFKDMADPMGQPFGYDFITYWAASHLALDGHAQDAYDTALLFKAQQIAVPAAFRNAYVWFYPPSFFLVVLPLALLPYIAAFWTFMLSTLGAYIFVLRRIVQGNTAMWCIAGFSGLWVNLFFGQNSFLTATLGGAAILYLERRPQLAGLFIGLLAAIKPHFAILFPVALIAIGAWRTLITAALTAITFTAIGTATLGTAVLKGFLANLGFARLLLENRLPWGRMPSLFAFGRLLGIPVAWAYVIHVVVAVGAAIMVWYVWRRCQERELRGAALMTATFLISPYVFDYDLAWLAFPIAWLALTGQQKGWSRGEREVLLVAWLLPMLMMVMLYTTYCVQIGPLVLCSLLWFTFRRATATSNMDSLEKGAIHISSSC
ncbi:MAG: DUF2029 domain-containing protein [Desulfobulbaceae bacterium]|nr:DUF2029 domain-containing protein [Desulfobulbaceae bacterium]